MSTSTFWFDLSGAVPWFLSGLLTALLLIWLRRLLFPRAHRRHPIELPPQPVPQDALFQQSDTGPNTVDTANFTGLEDELAAAKTDAVRFADEKQKLELEMRKLRETAKISPDGQTEIDRMRLSELTIRNQLADANAALSSLRMQAQSQDTKTKSLEADLAKMSSQVAMRDAELDRLEKQGSSGASTTAATALLTTERDQLKAKAAHLQADLDAAKLGGGNEAANLRLEVSRLQSALATAASTAAANTSGGSGSGGEALQLKSELAKLKADNTAQAGELENRAHHIRLRDAELDRLEKLVKAGTAGNVSGSVGGAAASVIAERDQLKADMEAARQAFEALKAEHDKAERALFNVGPEIEELRKFKASNASELARLTAQVGTLTADLDKFRRFKDALDTANRIAATRS